MNALKIPCPYTDKAKTKTQKRDMRQRWGSHLKAWIAETDRLYITNLRAVHKQIAEGTRSVDDYRKVTDILEGKAIGRANKELHSPEGRMRLRDITAAFHEWDAEFQAKTIDCRPRRSLPFYDWARGYKC